MHSVPRFPRRPRRACRGPPLLLCPQPPAPSMLAATPRCPACRYYRPALLLVVVLVQAILAHWRAELVWMEKDGALPSFSQVLIVAAMGNGCAPTAAARTCCRSAWAAAAAVVVTLCSVRRDHLALASSSRCVCMCVCCCSLGLPEGGCHLVAAPCTTLKPCAVSAPPLCPCCRVLFFYLTQVCGWGPGVVWAWVWGE